MKWHVKSRVHLLPGIRHEFTNFASVRLAITKLPKSIFYPIIIRASERVHFVSSTVFFLPIMKKLGAKVY